MIEPVLPGNLVEARRTPVFDVASLPAAFSRSHRTTVWAELRVQSGAVRFVDLDEDDPRDLLLEAGDCAVIVPGIEHHVEPSTDATFYVQFYREPKAGTVSMPAAAPVDARRRPGSSEHRRARSGHRGRDLRDGDAPSTSMSSRTTSCSRTSTSAPGSSTGDPTSVRSPTTGATSCSMPPTTRSMSSSTTSTFITRIHSLPNCSTDGCRSSTTLSTAAGPDHTPRPPRSERRGWPG